MRPKCRTATALLPNVIGTLVYGGTQRPVNCSGGLTLHVRRQVAGDVHCDCDRRVGRSMSVWVVGEALGE
jgi:hypothetical protein